MSAARLTYADDAEDRVLALLRAADDVTGGSAELAGLADTPALGYHFSPQRLGLLAPLALREGMRVLDLGCGSGVLTRALAEAGARVLGIEGVPKRAEAARQRCRDLPGVEIRTALLEPGMAALAEEGARFDLVLCCGVLEYSTAYGDGPEPFLAAAGALLGPAGVLALAIENQLGLGYLLGREEDHHGLPWIGAVDYPGGRGARTWSRAALTALLDGAGLGAQRWLLPYPDYKLPRTILDAELFDHPDAVSLVDKLVRDPLHGAFGANPAAVPVRGLHRRALAEGIAAALAPSFLVLAGTGADAVRAAGRPGLGWLVTNQRLPGWRRCRELVREPESPHGTVLRTLAGAGGQQGWLTQQVVPSEPVVPGVPLDAELSAALAAGDTDTARSLLGRWQAYYRTGERELRDEDPRHPFLPGLPGVAVLPPDRLDVHPGNLILDPEHGPAGIDREWLAGTGVDAELALVRGLWEYAREIHTAGLAHPWPATATSAELLFELAELAGLAEPARRRWAELHAAEAEFQELVTGVPGSAIAGQLRAQGANPGAVRPWEGIGGLGVREALAFAEAAPRGIEELRTEIIRQQANAGELAEAVTAQREHAEALAHSRAELSERLDATREQLAEAERAGERLRAELAETDRRLGLALAELAEGEQRREREAGQAAVTAERLRNTEATLASAGAQLELARRLPALRTALAHRAGGELLHEIDLPDATIHCGLGQVLELDGWVAHSAGRVRQVRVLADGREHRARVGFPRPDVRNTLRGKGLSVQDDSGIRVRLRLPVVTAPRAVRLELAVTLAGGRVVHAPLGEVGVTPGTGATPLAVHWPGAGPRVAICLSTYQPQPGYLREQLDSIRAQTHRNWVCLLADDGSDPAGRRAVTEAVGDDPRFLRLDFERNVGFYRNFERALLRLPADAEFVALSDQDDQWHPEKLARMLAEFDDPEVQLAYSDMRLVDAEGATLAETAWPPGRNQQTHLASLVLLNTVTGASSLMRAGLVRERALPFPPVTENLYHDHWLAVTALAAGRISFLPEPLLNYRQHGSNVTGWRLPRLDGDLPGKRQILALTAGLGRSAWLSGLSWAKDQELNHVALLGVERIAQWAELLLLRHPGSLSEKDRAELGRLLLADRRLAPLVELAARARLEDRQHTAGQEKRLLVAALYGRAKWNG